MKVQVKCHSREAFRQKSALVFIDTQVHKQIIIIADSITFEGSPKNFQNV